MSALLGVVIIATLLFICCLIYDKIITRRLSPFCRFLLIVVSFILGGRQ